MAGPLVEYLVDARRRGLAERTIKVRRNTIRAFERWLGDRPIFESERADIEAWLDSRGLAAQSRCNYVAHLHSFFDWAVYEQLTDADPTGRIRRPKVPRGLPRPIADVDLALALRSASGPMRAWLTLAAFAGLRCCEIARLRAEELELEADPAVLGVLGKGSKPRVIPAHPDVQTMLAMHGVPRRGLVFRRRSGLPLTADDVSHRMTGYLHRLELDATAHQLRHWFGTKMYQETRDLRLVQELMGHASPETTAIYTLYADGPAVTAVRALTLNGHMHGQPPTLF